MEDKITQFLSKEVAVEVERIMCWEPGFEFDSPTELVALQPSLSP